MRGQPTSDPPEDPPADPFAVAREMALRLLTVRAHSRQELEAALRRRRVTPDVIDDVLRRFGDVGLINDTDFAAGWVSSGRSRLRSGRRLRHELRAKGVTDDAAARAIAQREPDADLIAARAIAMKRLGLARGLGREARYRRVAGALARAGFSTDVVVRVTRETVGADVVEGDLDEV